MFESRKSSNISLIYHCSQYNHLYDLPSGYESNIWPCNESHERWRFWRDVILQLSLSTFIRLPKSNRLGWSVCTRWHFATDGPMGVRTNRRTGRRTDERSEFEDLDNLRKWYHTWPFSTDGLKKSDNQKWISAVVLLINVNNFRPDNRSNNRRDYRTENLLDFLCAFFSS